MIAELHGDQEAEGFFGDHHPMRDGLHILTDGQKSQVEREVLCIVGDGMLRGLVAKV
jgi:hypothetical protein